MAGNAYYIAINLYAYGMMSYPKMESKNGQRDEDDGVRGEGNVTNCLAVPLSEELVPGIWTCPNEEFEFRAVLLLIDDNMMSLCRMPAEIDHNILLLRS